MHIVKVLWGRHNCFLTPTVNTQRGVRAAAWKDATTFLCTLFVLDAPGLIWGPGHGEFPDERAAGLHCCGESGVSSCCSLTDGLPSEPSSTRKVPLQAVWQTTDLADLECRVFIAVLTYVYSTHKLHNPAPVIAYACCRTMQGTHFMSARYKFPAIYNTICSRYD